MQSQDDSASDEHEKKAEVADSSVGAQTVRAVADATADDKAAKQNKETLQQGLNTRDLLRLAMTSNDAMIEKAADDKTAEEEEIHEPGGVC